jgi:hypothetical protein
VSFTGLPELPETVVFQSRAVAYRLWRRRRFQFVLSEDCRVESVSRRWKGGQIGTNVNALRYFLAISGFLAVALLAAGCIGPDRRETLTQQPFTKLRNVDSRAAADARFFSRTLPYCTLRKANQVRCGFGTDSGFSPIENASDIAGSLTCEGASMNSETADPCVRVDSECGQALSAYSEAASLLANAWAGAEWRGPDIEPRADVLAWVPKMLRRIDPWRESASQVWAACRS